MKALAMQNTDSAIHNELPVVSSLFEGQAQSAAKPILTQAEPLDAQSTRGKKGCGRGRQARISIITEENQDNQVLTQQSVSGCASKRRRLATPASKGQC